MARGSLVAAVLCLVGAVTLPALAQEDSAGPRPDVWRGAAHAGVATVDVNRDALIPVEGVFRFIAPEASGVYETDLQTARASLLYPGEGAIQGPNLACGTFGGSFPPEFKPVLDACVSFDYPLSVRADASTPDAASDGRVALGQPTDPISAEAVGAVAHAAPDGSRAAAQIADLHVLGMPGVAVTSILPIEELEVDPTVLRVGSATSRTDQRFEGGSLVVTARSELTGVALVGGLVKVGSIVSTSTATDDAHGRRTAAADVEVSGVTVAGFPAEITQDGLVIGSPGGSGPVKQQVQQAANQLLAALGVRISLLDNEETTDDGTGLARALAPGVLLEVTTRADGLPPVPGPLGDIDLNGEYVGTIQLGSSGASTGAASFEDEVPPDVGAGAPVASGSVPTDAGFVDTPAPSAEPSAASDQPPVAPSSEQYLRRIVDRFGGRVGLVYLAFAFTVLGLCLLPRLTLPARLPGASP